MAKRRESTTLTLRDKGLNMGTLLDALPDSPEPEDRAGKDYCNTYTAADETEPQSLLPCMQPQNIPATTFQGSSTTDRDVGSRGSSRRMNQDSPESVAVSVTVSHNGVDFQRCDADASESTSHTSDTVPEDVTDPAKTPAPPSHNQSSQVSIFDKLLTSSDEGCASSDTNAAESTSHTSDIVSENVIDLAKTPAPPSHNQSSVVPIMDKLSTSSDEGCSSSDADAAESTRHTSDIVSEDVIDLARHPTPPSHNQSSVVPVMDKLSTSSDKGHSNSGNTSSSEHSVTDRDLVDSGKPKDAGEANVRQIFSRVQHAPQGFLFGPAEKLQDSLMKIVTGPRDFGIYVWDVSSASVLTTEFLCG